MAFRKRNNKTSIIFSNFSLFVLGGCFSLSFFFLKRFIFRLVTEGWQNAGKLKVLQSRLLGQFSKAFQGNAASLAQKSVQAAEFEQGREQKPWGKCPWLFS